VQFSSRIPFWRILLPPNFKVDVEVEVARSFRVLVSYCNTVRHHNPEDLNLNHYLARYISDHQSDLPKIMDTVQCTVSW
jgi:hypothetical protein